MAMSCETSFFLPKLPLGRPAPARRPPCEPFRVTAIAPLSHQTSQHLSRLCSYPVDSFRMRSGFDVWCFLGSRLRNGRVTIAETVFIKDRAPWVVFTLLAGTHRYPLNTHKHFL